jgi:hypothetical protein
MIVWGGFGGGYENSGARYCACADRQVIYRDDDADGEGSALTPTAGSCDGTVPPGYVATGSDCNDGDPNNWDSCGTCVDGDGDSAFAGCDRYLTIVGPDCNDADAATFAGAPEVNDGIDNQCAVGETGYGLIDELSGTLNVVIIGSDSYVIWESQSGATSYEGVRATSPEFASGCTTFVSEGVSILDTEVPAGGGAFYYLVRPLTPYAGSFGLRSDGAPRAVCP